MVDCERFFEYHPQRKFYEFDLRPPAQRSRMRKRVEAAVIEDISEMMYEMDDACRRKLGSRCVKLQDSPQFVYICLMLQDRVRPMEIVRYLQRHDPQNFGQWVISDDALRVQIERMRRYLFTKRDS